MSRNTIYWSPSWGWTTPVYVNKHDAHGTKGGTIGLEGAILSPPCYAITLQGWSHRELDTRPTMGCSRLPLSQSDTGSASSKDADMINSHACFSRLIMVMLVIIMDDRFWRLTLFATVMLVTRVNMINELHISIYHSGVSWGQFMLVWWYPSHGRSVKPLMSFVSLSPSRGVRIDHQTSVIIMN